MKKSYKGSCLCGDATFTIEGAFEHFFLCHCKHCQKDTGSAHAANLLSPTATIEWISGQEKLKTFKLPSTMHVRSFCATCGSALPNIQMEGKLLVVPAGSLDDEVSNKPNAHIFVSSKANWDNELERVQAIEKLPD